MKNSRLMKSKLVDFFIPQLVFLKRRAVSESTKRGQRISVNSLVRELVQREIMKEKNEIKAQNCKYVEGG